MALVAGIDPGVTGALAVYDSITGKLVMVEDLPFWFQSVGTRKKKRLDPIGLSNLIGLVGLMGVELIVLEAVGGRPKQSAMGGFSFGYAVGMIYMSIMYEEIMLETVPPAQWKKLMNIPGKAKAGDEDILNRADEMFPDSRALFRGPQGGRKLDRAEAAMLAKFGADYVLRTLKPTADTKTVEFRAAIVRADTGA
jgi:crossover junction endodeoxyribonuclease RuvC